jgi:hypothetical protein
MSAMGEMPTPGGWTMSMAWMRMPGQTWPGAAASFLGMWGQACFLSRAQRALDGEVRLMGCSASSWSVRKYFAYTVSISGQSIRL